MQHQPSSFLGWVVYFSNHRSKEVDYWDALTLSGGKIDQGWNSFEIIDNLWKETDMAIAASGAYGYGGHGAAIPDDYVTAKMHADMARTTAKQQMHLNAMQTSIGGRGIYFYDGSSGTGVTQIMTSDSTTSPMLYAPSKNSVMTNKVFSPPKVDKRKENIKKVYYARRLRKV